MTPDRSQQVNVDGEFDPEFARTIQQEVDLGVRALEQGQPDMAIGFFQSARAKVAPDFPFFDHLAHNLLLAYKKRIEQLFGQQRTGEAMSMLDEALALDITGPMVDDDVFRRSFADAFYNLGQVCFENLQLEGCVRCCRKTLSINHSPTYHVNLTNALSILKQPLLLSDLTDRITVDQLGKHIFIACVPKSASTFLKNVLVALTGYRDVFAVFAAGQNEHDLYLPALIQTADMNTVTQQHCRASAANIQVMQGFGIRPVVLVRNIFDAIVSQLDFYRQGAYFNSYSRGDFLGLDEETQIDLLIDTLAPWYLQFVASWQLAQQENRLEIYWLTYEDLTTKKVDTISNILAFYGVGASNKNIERAIASTEAESRKNRFNRGVAGRGAKGLTEAQKSRIISLTRYFPNTDFGLIGLQPTL